MAGRHPKQLELAYASIAKRDERAISQFANVIRVSGIFGRPKKS
jgi:hypothetical protein